MTKNRLDGEGSVYQRKRDGRWVASVSLGRRPDGKRDRRVLYGKTRAEALAAKQELLERADEAPRARPGTVGDFLQRWSTVDLPLRVAAGDLAQSTCDQYTDKVTRYVIPTKLGQTRMRDVGPADVREWLAWLSGRKTSRGRPMTPGGVRLVYRILRAALQDAVDDGLLARHPATTVKPPKAKKFKAKPLTVAEAQAVLSVEHRLRPLWVAFLYLGLRHSEALDLRWEWVDFDEGLVYVNGTKNEEAEGAVPLPGVVAEVLQAHRKEQRVTRLKSVAWVDPGLVFPSTAGTRLNPSNVRAAWRQTCAAAGVDARRIHDLRHSTATLLYAAGVPDVTISKILRHSSPTVTRDIYTHVFKDTQRVAVDALGDLLRKEQG